MAEALVKDTQDSRHDDIGDNRYSTIVSYLHLSVVFDLDVNGGSYR